MTISTIPLTQGYVATVDDADYEWLAQWKWCVQVTPRAVYAIRHERRQGKQTRYYMHRQILGATANDNRQVDHIDGNGLNNVRSNLRFANYRQNQANSRVAHGASRYRGVTLENGRWRVRIRTTGKKVHVGTFSDEMEAARAYDRAALKLHGAYARLNFPKV